MDGFYSSNKKKKLEKLPILNLIFLNLTIKYSINVIYSFKIML